MEEQITQPPVINLPEPTISGTFGHSWEILKKNFLELLLVLLLQILLSLPMCGASLFRHGQDFNFGFYSLFNIVYGIFVLMPVGYGTRWVFLRAVRGEPFKATEIFMAFQMIWNVILANVLVFLIVGIGFILLIVPGIIFACKLAFVPYLVTDQKMEPMDAVKKSWEMTKGFSWTIFGMAIVSFFVAIAGLICLIVGIFPAAIWISCAFATLFWVVSQRTVKAQ